MTGIQVEESRRAGVRLEGDQGLAATAANHLLCKKNHYRNIFQLMKRKYESYLSIWLNFGKR